MMPDEILKEVNLVFIDVLDNPAIVLGRNTTARDVAEWDSLNHIMLIVGIEKKFKFRFTAEEVQNFKNVGEMCDTIQKKTEN
jgi:acyl carrier protein